MRSFDSLKAMVASEIDINLPHLGQDTVQGAIARALPALNACRYFYLAELRRSTARTPAETAMLTIMGNMIATMAMASHNQPHAKTIEAMCEALRDCALRQASGAGVVISL